MIKQAILIPSLGESITQVTIGALLKPNGTIVRQDDELLEIETDKLNQVIYAPSSGVLHISVEKGQVCSVGSDIGWIEVVHQQESLQESLQEARQKEVSEILDKPRKKEAINEPMNESASDQYDRCRVTPLSAIRKAISKRLKEVQSSTVMLTTFNEVDMTALMDLRNKHKDDFQKAHSVKLGYMSFFVKAASLAIDQFPQVNSFIDGDNFVTREYIDIGVAVASKRGLVVPILRNANTLSFAEIEHHIETFRIKADAGELRASDMQGGSFTITNGGVFGSLLSTPILNPPQSAILGMHKITQRPVVIDEKIVIRSMMYLALTYDHCVMDGKDAVQFLSEIKKILEEPERFVLELV